MKLFLEAVVFGVFALLSAVCTCINAWQEHLSFAFLCAIVSVINIYFTLVAVDRGIRNRWGMKE